MGGAQIFLAAVVGLGALVVPPVLAPSVAGAASPGDVVISEIHYKPDDGDSEFVEITNNTDAEIDLSGWVFSEAFDFAFDPGTNVVANGRVVVTRSAADFSTTYGFEAAGEFADGSLANSSDTLVLRDDAGAVIDTVTYLDDSPWPPGPDNNGTSLELNDLLSENSDAANWAESLVIGGTPAAQNTAEISSTLPSISDISTAPLRPQPDDEVVIGAAVEAASDVQLTYRIEFGPEVVVSMLDDAASPGGAGDGVYGATIPGQIAGELVRYRIDAINPNGSVGEPTVVDARDYVGYVVADPSRQSAVPVVEWWMPDRAYREVLREHRYDDMLVDAVFTYDGHVWDNTQMRIRGGVSRKFSHPSWKVEFPDGELFEIPGYTSSPVDEFNMQWDGMPNAAVAWEIAREIGFPTVDYFPINVYRNGEFWGAASYSTALDGRWRDEHGLGEANVYKAVGGLPLTRKPDPFLMGGARGLEHKEGPDDDYEEVWEFANILDDQATKAQYEALLDELDVPAVINYLAFSAYIKDWDIAKHNFYLVNDDAGTDRWFVLPWDIENIFNTHHGDYLFPVGVLPERVLAHPEFREMYVRRLKTLIDQFPLPSYPVDEYESRYLQIADLMADDFELREQGYADWNQADPPEQRSADFPVGVQQRHDLFEASTGPTGVSLIPPSQTDVRPIVISEINYAPGAGSVEFIELTNTSLIEAFDLSGWEIDGAGVTIAPGTVLRPGDQVVFVENDRLFRSGSGPAYVAGELGDDLDDGGETLTLLDGDGQQVDQVTYAAASPWPLAPRGFGSTLELIDAALDNDTATNWAPSSREGGTPAAANEPSVEPRLPLSNPGLILNEYNAVSDGNVLKNDGADTFFGASVGNGGDWFELVVVQDGLDVRGWTLNWADDDGSGSLQFADDPQWAALRSGTILTIAEQVGDDTSFDPDVGDWWINAQPGAPGSGALLTGEPLEVSNSDWQLRIVDATGTTRFGPGGEGAGGLGGVGSTEIARLEDDPTPSVNAYSSYDDAASSTFGAPNGVGGGSEQDLTDLREDRPAAVAAGPFDTTVTAGLSATFEVAIEGSAPVALQWRRDGIDLSGETGPMLHIAAATLADDGAAFDVAVSNRFGTAVSASATLTVELEAARVTAGLQALWKLNEGGGTLLHDSAGVGVAADLTIEDPAKVVWLPGGGIRLDEFVDISGPATRLIDASIRSDEFTIEAWVDPAAAEPSTPGWIAGMSETRTDRNVMMAQGFYGSDPSSSVRVKYRTDDDSFRSVNSPDETLEGGLVHLVVTRSSDGVVRIYADGVEVASDLRQGRLMWVEQLFRLGSGGPSYVPAAFEGDILLAAYYSRSLSAVEVLRNHQAGITFEPPVPVGPTVSSPPSDTTVGAGRMASFSVSAEGTAPLTYQWRRDGVDVVGEDGPTLTVGPVQLADDGATFDIVISNPLDSIVSESARLTVTEAPPGPLRVGYVAGSTPPPSKDEHSIGRLEGLDLEVVVIDDDAVSPAAVAGFDLIVISSSVVPSKVGSQLRDTPIPILTWEAYLYDDLAMSGPGNNEIASDDDLDIVNAAHPIAAGNSGRVTVLTSPRGMSVGNPTSDADIIARPSGDGRSAIFAYEPGDELSNGDFAAAGRVGFFFDYFAPTRANQNGWAMFDAAVAWLIAGAEPPAPVSPIVTAQPVDVTIQAGAAATFSVIANGTAPLSYQWRRDGVDMTDENGPSLSVGPVGLADDGATFDVVVANSVGSTTSGSAVLTVTEPPAPEAPAVTLDPVDVTVVAGGPATFIAAASGVPAPDLQWRRDGVDLPGETAPSLQLSDVSAADDGAVFDAVATNASGSATTAAAVLTVEEAVGITVEGNPTVTVIEGASVLEVSWGPVAGASLYQLRYRPLGSRRVWQPPTIDMESTLAGLSGGLMHTVEVRAYTSSWGPFTLVAATPT